MKDDVFYTSSCMEYDKNTLSSLYIIDSNFSFSLNKENDYKYLGSQKQCKSNLIKQLDDILFHTALDIMESIENSKKVVKLLEKIHNNKIKPSSQPLYTVSYRFNTSLSTNYEDYISNYRAEVFQTLGIVYGVSYFLSSSVVVSSYLGYVNKFLGMFNIGYIALLTFPFRRFIREYRLYRALDKKIYELLYHSFQNIKERIEKETENHYMLSLGYRGSIYVTDDREYIMKNKIHLAFSLHPTVRDKV